MRQKVQTPAAARSGLELVVEGLTFPSLIVAASSESVAVRQYRGELYLGNFPMFSCGMGR